MGRIFWLLIFLTIPCGAETAFMKVTDIHETTVRKIIISDVDDRLIYAVSQTTLVKSSDRSKTWKDIFSTRSEDIRDLVVDRRLYDTVYLLGEYSLYRIRGNEVRKIFTVEPENQLRCVFKRGDEVFLGTDTGLYAAVEGIWEWSKLSGFLQNTVVYSMDACDSDLYVAASSGVYRLSEGLRVQKAFLPEEGFLTDEETEAEEPGFSPRSIRCDREDKDVIYLGTTRGLFISRDRGHIFEKESVPGVENADVRCVTQPSYSRGELYLATDGGLILLDLERRQSRRLFEGLSTDNIFWVDFDRAGKLFVATARGLFQKDEFTPSEYTSRIRELLRREPSCLVVQESALKYNNVHPDKIRQWRNSLKYRALFPQVSVDYDKTIYGTYSNGGQFAVGPRDWGLNLSWDVADLIWNTYQDDIDTRSRLNAQLRNNILDDINTVYFARLRIKAELQDPALSPADRTEKELRLMELTAILDGYTGGFFSKRREELANRN